MEILRLSLFLCAVTQIFSSPKEEIFVEPLIDDMQITSYVNHTYAETTVAYSIRNTQAKAERINFSVDVPKLGFLTGFKMEIDGRNFTASAKKISEAQQSFNKATFDDLRAGHLVADTTDPNHYKLSLNVKARSEAKFYLTYMQQIRRVKNWAELTYSVNPEHVWKNYSVNVFINENQTITNIVPFAFGVLTLELSQLKVNCHPDSNYVAYVDNNEAHVRFSLNKELQKRYSLYYTMNEFSQKFVIQYEIEKDSTLKEIDNELELENQEFINPILTSREALVVEEPTRTPQVTTPRLHFGMICRPPVVMSDCFHLPRLG